MAWASLSGDTLPMGPEMGARASSPAPVMPQQGGGFNWKNAMGYGLMGLAGGLSGQNMAPMLLLSQMMGQQRQQDPQALARLIARMIEQQRAKSQQAQQVAQAPITASSQVVGDTAPNMNLLGGAF